MLKKILIFIICVLLGMGIYNAAVKGITIFGQDVKSYGQLVDGNKELDTRIETLNRLNDVTYPQSIRRLQSIKNTFKSQKNEYDSLAASASTSEVAEANKREQYLLDFLWMKIGSYANSDNVRIKMEPGKDTPVVNFDVTGEYIAVVNFIYDLENDNDLSFNVDNIVMQGGSSDVVTKATFQVTGVNIVTSETEE